MTLIPTETITGQRDPLDNYHPTKQPVRSHHNLKPFAAGQHRYPALPVHSTLSNGQILSFPAAVVTIEVRPHLFMLAVEQRLWPLGEACFSQKPVTLCPLLISIIYPSFTSHLEARE